MKKIFLLFALVAATAEIISAAADKTSAEKSSEAMVKINEFVRGTAFKVRINELNTKLDDLIKLALNLTDPGDIEYAKADLKPLRMLFSLLEKLKKMGLLTD